MKKLDPWNIDRKVFYWEFLVGESNTRFSREFKSPREFKEFIKNLEKERKEQIDQNLEVVFKSLGKE